MAQFGFSLVGLLKAINNMEAVQSAFPTEKSYVVSTDFDSAPYAYFRRGWNPLHGPKEIYVEG